MSIIAPTNGHDPVAEHPIILDLQTKVAMIYEIIRRMDERQEHLIAQSGIIVERIKALGGTGALED